MALAWSKDWLGGVSVACKEDPLFQEVAAVLNRSFTVIVRAEPDKGIDEDIWFGFHAPTMEKAFSGEEDVWETDYSLEGSYTEWHAVNEGLKGLVASLLGGSIALKRGSTSYLSMFVPAIERFFQLSREKTTEYLGEFQCVGAR